MGVVVGGVAGGGVLWRGVSVECSGRWPWWCGQVVGGLMEKGRKGLVDLEGLMGGLKLTEEERRVVRGARQSGAREAGRHPQAVG